MEIFNLFLGIAGFFQNQNFLWILGLQYLNKSYLFAHLSLTTNAKWQYCGTNFISGPLYYKCQTPKI